jgi:queuine tRNA-ribosyltransferase
MESGKPDGAGGFEVVTTTSGACAVRDRAVGEVMHPVVGPRVESRRLYIEPARLVERLSQPLREPLVLFDVGLGAGSNALAAWQAAAALGEWSRPLTIVSFDRTVAALALATSAQHASSFGYEGDSLRAAHALIARHVHATGRTVWRLEVGELSVRMRAQAEASADVVFWDPYSPRANPELWSVAAFRALRRVCRAGATVHTYSGATAVRTALLLAGFAVGLGPRVSDKKWSTVAAVNRQDLAEPLSVAWLERVRRSSAPFPPDAPARAVALAMLEASAQFAAAADVGAP